MFSGNFLKTLADIYDNLKSFYFKVGTGFCEMIGEEFGNINCRKCELVSTSRFGFNVIKENLGT